MKSIKILTGTVSFLTLVCIGYYGCLKSVERMYGISIGLMIGGILAKTTTDDISDISTKSTRFTFVKPSHPKRRRKILKSLRPNANFFQ